MFAPHRTTTMMGGQQDAQRQKRHETQKSFHPAPPALVTRPPARWVSRSFHDAGFLLALVLLAAGTILSFSRLGATMGRQARATPRQQTAAARSGISIAAPPPIITTTVRSAQRHLYTFARSNVGLMQLAVDAQGNAWVGEMHANRLGRLNAQTGVVSSWTPPDAEYGIMSTTIDAQGNAWFVERNANYIGRFDKRQQTFRLFPLGTWKGSLLGPQDLHFDARGQLWFTGETAGALGRLDPTSGAIRLWPVPSPAPGISSSPSSLTVTPNGRVWFGDFAAGVIGSLNPASGQITLYHLPNQQAQVFSMATDSAGRLWFTEVLPGKLAMFDPATGTLTELPVPALAGGPPALYELVIDHQEQIWFVDVGANTLVRYAPEKQTFTFFQLSLPGSAPFGLTLDPAGRLWFTAGGSGAEYVGEMFP